jgi:hypothetical protein
MLEEHIINFIRNGNTLSDWVLDETGEIMYSPTTGNFIWVTPKRGRSMSRFAGGLSGRYRVIGYQGKACKAHRLAWKIMTGEWPPAEIDHKNLDKIDNRWQNLRLASRSENSSNKSIGVSNTSGVKGVSWHKGRRHWRAQIKINGKTKALGGFKTKEEAQAVYVKAAEAYFGEFARLD